MPTTMTMGTSYHFVPDTLKEEERWINTDIGDTECGEQCRVQVIALRVGPRESLIVLFGSPFLEQKKTNWKFNVTM